MGSGCPWTMRKFNVRWWMTAEFAEERRQKFHEAWNARCRRAYNFYGDKTKIGWYEPNDVVERTFNSPGIPEWMEVRDCTFQGITRTVEARYEGAFSALIRNFTFDDGRVKPGMDI